METYRHSGAISPMGILLASSAGIATAIVLGVVYSFGIVHIPYVKIHGLLTVGFGCLMGVSVGWGAKVGKIRNTFVAMAYGFVVGLIGLYVAWGTDFLARDIIPAGGQRGDYPLAYSPTLLWEYIKWFYENGQWGLSKGAMVSGVMLGFFWAFEAVIIVGGSTVLAGIFIADVPFCETCSRWTVKKAGTRPLSLIGAGDELQRLLSGDLSSLANFNLAQNDAVYLQLDLASCPACTESNFLTIQQVKQTLDKEGKLQQELKPLLQNMVLSPEDLPLIENAGREPLPSENADRNPEGEEPPKPA